MECSLPSSSQAELQDVFSNHSFFLVLLPLEEQCKLPKTGIGKALNCHHANKNFQIFWKLINKPSCLVVY